MRDTLSACCLVPYINVSQPFVRAVFIVSVLIITTKRVITRVFILNFSTAGPNATALLACTLVTGITVPIVLRSYSTQREWVLIFLTAVGILISFSTMPIISLLGAAVAIISLTSLLIVETSMLDQHIGVATGLGVLTIVMTRAIAGAVSLYATTVGRVGIVGIVFLLIFVSLARGDEATDQFITTTTLPSFAPLAGVLLLCSAWLAAPVASAQWAGYPYFSAVVYSVGGLTTGIVIVAVQPLSLVQRTILADLSVITGIAGILTGGMFGAAGTVLAATSVPILASTGGRNQMEVWHVGIFTACVQGACLAMLFGFVFALNAAFAPGGMFLEGRAVSFMTGLTVLIALTAFAVSIRTPSNDSESSTTGYMQTRRSMLACLATGSISTIAAWRSAPQMEHTTETELRVATYNIRRYFDPTGAYNLESVANVLQAQRAGIIGLQETTGTRLTTGHTHGVRWLAARLGYHHAIAPSTSAEGYGVALLSTYPITHSQTISLPQTDGPPRDALHAVVDHPRGLLSIVVAHLDTAGQIRVRQTAKIQHFLDGTDPAVVLGDFNATPTEQPIRLMSQSFVDAWDMTGRQNGETFETPTPSRRIDYVFVRGLTVQNASTFGTTAESDHRGVRATLSRVPEGDSSSN